jgi:hypothetical protein
MNKYNLIYAHEKCMIFPAPIFVKQMLKQHYAHISYMEFESNQSNLGSVDNVSWCLSQSKVWLLLYQFSGNS